MEKQDDIKIYYCILTPICIDFVFFVKRTTKFSVYFTFPLEVGHAKGKVFKWKEKN